MKVIKNVFNILVGLLSVLFTYAVRIAFILMTLLDIYVMLFQSYLFLKGLIIPNSESYSALVYTMTMTFGVGFLVLSALSNVGWADLSKFMRRVFSLMFETTHTDDGTKKRVGKNGVFRNE